jgi:hypothetical protein
MPPCYLPYYKKIVLILEQIEDLSLDIDVAIEHFSQISVLSLGIPHLRDLGLSPRMTPRFYFLCLTFYFDEGQFRPCTVFTRSAG